MKHIIITHFNLKLWRKDKKDLPTQTKDWLDKRFQLFDDYCFPSVLAQTDKNFYWFCLFDIDTPDTYKDRIDNYRKQMPQFMPFFLTRDEAIENDDLYIKNKIKEILDANDEQIITTCLDNDDAIQMDFVKEINEIAREESEPDVFCVFDYGYQYYTKFDFLMKFFYPTNHFHTRIERDLTDFKTARAIIHAHLRKKSVRKKFKVIHIDNIHKPMWIEVIHENNMSNDVHISFRPKDTLTFFKSKPMLDKIDKTDFGLKKDIAMNHQLYKCLRFYLPRAMNITVSKLKKKFSKPNRIGFFA